MAGPASFAVPETRDWLRAMEHARRRETSAFGAAGYDAVLSRGKRQQPTGILRSEEQELPGVSRRRLVSTTRDLRRNFEVAAWAVRRHLDYTTSFRYQCKTPDRDLNRRIEGDWAEWSEPEQCDVRGRHGFPEMVRLAEAGALVDGDVFAIKLADGRLQWIEGDRVRRAPTELALTDYGHGVTLDQFGRAKSYSVCRRAWAGGFVFEREVPAQHVVHHAFVDRFDQVRGVSPIACAINRLRDCYENFDYALAKSKVAQLFGLVFYRDGLGQVGQVARQEDADGDGTPDAPGYQVDFGKGPIQLDLDPGDKAEFLESQTPGTAFESFTETMIAVALKALDIPFSFYRENFSTYSGSRQALLMYDLSAKWKRRNTGATYRKIHRWWLECRERKGLLPKSVRACDVRFNLIHEGLPWIDPVNEVQADVTAIGASLASRRRILAEQGQDFEEVAGELAEENKLLTELGLSTAAATKITERIASAP